MMGEQDTRCWRYRAGEARIFPSPEAVPAGEGWVDSPAKVAEPEQTGETGKNRLEPEKADIAADPAEPEADDELRAHLDARGWDDLD